jgi:hypothetical protein
MAEKIIVNATGTALAAEGETTAAWSVAESTGAPTVTEQGAISDTNGFAVIQTGATAAELGAIAWCILDSLTTGIDLSTQAKREQFKLKASREDFKRVLETLPENIVGQVSE